MYGSIDPLPDDIVRTLVMTRRSELALIKVIREEGTKLAAKDFSINGDLNTGLDSLDWYGF